MDSKPAASTARARSSLPDLLPLVGRKEELTELESLLDGEDLDTSVVFLRGDGGVGKSRLAGELAERAARRGWKVASGRAYPVETGVPYALFSDAFLPILRELDSHTLTVLSRGGEAELEYLFPALGRRERDADGLASGEPDEFRTRLMWNFAEFVKRFAAREPLLLVLEDLQWADESSLQLMHFLARQVSGNPVLILCSYNDQERDRSPQLIQTERSLVSMHLATVHHLESLSLDQIAELVQRAFGIDGDSIREFAAVLFGWTRGNAFFAEEIMKALVTSGAIRYESGTWIGWDAKEFGMPGSIRDAVMGRMHALSDAARKVAEIAAVIGTRASYPLLASVSGIRGPDLLAALEELCTMRVLNERAEGHEVVYHFAHPIVRQILYGEFGLARARVLHGIVAEAMEAHYGQLAMDHADELAFHFTRTDDAPLRAKATEYLAAAGRRALDRRADQEAISYLEAALERIDEMGSPGTTTRSDLLPPLARAHIHMGRFDEAAALWTLAVEDVADDSREYLTARRSLGMAHFWCGRHDEAHEHFDLGLAAARKLKAHADVARLLVAKAHCLQEIGKGAEALEALQAALPLAQDVGSPLLLARVHRALALLHVWIGPPAEAERHGERAIELAAAVDEPAIEFWARWGLAVLSGMRGDTARMEAAVGQLIELADQLRSPVLRLWTADMSVELAYARGEWDRGIAEGERAIALARALNQRTLLPRLLVWTSQFYIGRGDAGRAAELVGEAQDIAGLDRDDGSENVHQVVPTYIGTAHYLVGLGDYEAAIEAAQKGLGIAEGTGYVLWAIHQLLPILAEASIWAGHFERAAEVGARMRAHSELIDHRLGIAWADACDSLVMWKRGDGEGSIRLMEAAADALAEIPMLWGATRLRRQLASRLWEAGRAEEAKAQLDRVWEVCVKVQAGVEREKARSDYRKMGLRAPTEHRTDGPLGVTPEELEIAKLVSLGLSNKAIALRRQSEVRTVSTHLSNIYKKLEIGGPGARVRLGNLVRDAGLTD